MRHRLSLLLVVALLVGTLACGPASVRVPADLKPGPPAAPEAYPGGELLVSVEWLHEHLDDPSLRVVDLSARVDYQRGHVPGAIHLWWQDTIEVHNETFGMLVGEPGMARLIADAGITPESTVILYDASGNRYAARFLWALHAIGFERVRLLNGGRQAWQLAGLPMEQQPPTIQPGHLEQQLNYDVLIGAQSVLDYLDDPSVVIVDNRTEEERRDTWFGRLRVGRIPGAVSVPHDAMTADGPIPYYADPETLRRLFETRGVTPDKTVIVYGQHGVLAAQTYVALKLLGYPSVRVYDGSWAEWGARDDLPIEPLPDEKGS